MTANMTANAPNASPTLMKTQISAAIPPIRINGKKRKVTVSPQSKVWTWHNCSYIRVRGGQFQIRDWAAKARDR
jgi:hypothetical protein